MKVCVQGLWHLGSVTAACLAAVGHEVVGLDSDETTVRGLAAGSPPIAEPGLADSIAAGLAAGRLRFTTLPQEIPSDIQILWVTYDTPVDEDDVANVDFVVAQVEKTLPHLPPNVTVLVSSQLPVGTIRRLEEIAFRTCRTNGITFACSPENLRLGKALDVFLKPGRVVVGIRGEKDRERIRSLLTPITDRIEWMSVESAEMTKHAINAFLATSVVFANEIASVCEVVGADAKEVERGLKSEQRIGPKAYLSPGGAFAGGTLARDIEFLQAVSRREHVGTPLLGSVKTSNDLHKTWVRRKLKAIFPAIRGVRVAVWGLTYKPGTDTLRRSLAIELCDWLLTEGATIAVHDPAVKALPEEWSGRVRRTEDPIAALSDAQVLLVGTEWPAYRELPREKIAVAWNGLVVIDANRFLSSFAALAGGGYFAVGTPSFLEVTK
jgi:UDPglucose 6-dehydrogenase